MLDELELLEQLKNYLQSKETNYAVLIDGDWGVGKTYFIKKNIELLLEKPSELKTKYKGFIYVSLYGIKETSKIDNSISSNILSRSKLLKPLKNKSKSAEMISTIFNVPFINKRTLSDVAKEFQSFNQYVLIFDDLERSDIPINELLGYINNLVETEQIKVIVIGNQKEIDVTRLSKNQELKYFFSLLYQKTYNETEDNKKKISRTEIKKNADDFFRESEEYQIIKEKTFGFTYMFKPNVEPILTEFINEYLEENQKFLSIEKLKKIIDKHEINNLRTLIVTFNNFRMIEKYLIVDNLGIDLDEIKNRIFEAILYFTKKHSLSNINSNYVEEPINDFFKGFEEKIQYENYYTFISDLVGYGSTKNFKTGLDKLIEHIKFMSIDNLQRDLMYKLQHFITLEDREVQESISLLLNLLNNGSFDPKYSSIAIEIVITLSFYGFDIDKNYVEKIKMIAVQNLEKFEEVVRFGRVQYTGEITKEVNNEVEDLSNMFESKSMSKITDYDSDWLSFFGDYCINNQTIVRTKGLFSFLNLDSLLKWILLSTPKEIDDFRSLLVGYRLVINAQEKYKEKYIIDLKALYEGLATIVQAEQQITKKVQIEFLQSNILEILKDY